MRRKKDSELKPITLTGRDTLRVVQHVFYQTNAKTKKFDASYQEIMEATNVSRTTASKAVNYLIKNKFLKKVDDYVYKVKEYDSLERFSKNKELTDSMEKANKREKLRKKGLVDDDYLIEDFGKEHYYNKKGVPKSFINFEV